MCIFSFILQASEAELDPSNPDDRFFIIHEIDNGMVFVQPYHHKGGYSRLVSTLKKKRMDAIALFILVFEILKSTIFQVLYFKKLPLIKEENLENKEL